MFAFRYCARFFTSGRVSVQKNAVAMAHHPSKHKHAGAFLALPISSAPCTATYCSSELKGKLQSVGGASLIKLLPFLCEYVN